jgi:hypothetical protein
MADSTDHHAVLPTLASKIETAQAGIFMSSGLSPGHLNLIATRLSYEASPSEAPHPPFSSFAPPQPPPPPSICVRRITSLDLRTLTTTVLHCRYLVLAADYLAATAVIGAYPPTRVPRLSTACLTFPHGWVMYAVFVTCKVVMIRAPLVPGSSMRPALSLLQRHPILMYLFVTSNEA